MGVKNVLNVEMGYTSSNKIIQTENIEIKATLFLVLGRD